ncbi:MAG: class I SAM-dependent methyltransferase [Dehalococcoidia bacterium]|nr:class I SAM-dependent methyltransferase [Dehalococcoidia bacterium]
MEEITAPGIDAYASEHSTPEPAYLRRIGEHTQELSPASQMLVGHVEGRLLKMLVAMCRPMHVVEVGTFTGYSALCMAEGLPEGGRLITLEVDPEHARIAQEHIDTTHYADRIEIRQGHAMDLLGHIPAPVDFAFIDADKSNYLRYYEALLPLLPPGGFLAADNVLWSGAVLDASNQEADTVALREFNDFVRRDERVEAVMLTVRDGVTLVRKRP